MKFMTHEAGLYGSDDGRGANWHPTRAFHMLRGEAISWLYTLALLDAIYMVEADTKTGKIDDLKKNYLPTIEKLQPPMPPPKKCQNYHCDKRPMCYTDYEPHFSKVIIN